MKQRHELIICIKARPDRSPPPRRALRPFLKRSRHSKRRRRRGRTSTINLKNRRPLAVNPRHILRSNTRAYLPLLTSICSSKIQMY